MTKFWKALCWPFFPGYMYLTTKRDSEVRPAQTDREIAVSLGLSGVAVFIYGVILMISRDPAFENHAIKFLSLLVSIIWALNIILILFTAHDLSEKRGK